MEFNATIDLIIKDLNDASQIIDDLKNYPGVPELQVELAKAKCKSAGEVIALLKNIKQQPFTKTEIKVPENKAKEVPATEIILQKIEAAADREAKKEDKEQAAATEKSTPPADESRVKQESQGTGESDEKADKGSSIFADKFSNISSSLNEQLGSRKGDEDVSGRIKSKPIPSLKDAIGINDRFLFIREIFNGDKEIYNQVIAKLEDVRSITDAKDVISGHAVSSANNDAYKQLLDLVKRKINPNE